MEYYSTIKKCEIIKFANKWMELENILKTLKPKRQMSHVLSHMWALASNFVSCVWPSVYMEVRKRVNDGKKALRKKG